jgi:spore coat protein CotF
VNHTESLHQQEIFEDMRISEEQLSAAYNGYIGEASSQVLYSELLGILNDEHEMKSEVYSEQRKRGWSRPTVAKQDEIDHIRKKYQKDSN